MSKETQELAELLGWKFEGRKIGSMTYMEGWWSPEGKNAIYPDYDTDLNAMREVWKVLYERGLWGEFYKTWDVEIDNCHTLKAPAAFYRFLNNLPGQVQAAIKVLKK